jgi:hypothetical protein
MSSYRDERGALQERVGVLEEDLRDAREKADKADALGRDVADKEKEIAKLRARLVEHEGPPKPPGSRAASLIALAAVALLGATAAGVFLLRAPAAPPRAAAAVVAPGDELPEPCEAYFREIERCVAAHPEMAALRDNAPQQRAAFKTGLATPAAREAILNACGQSLKALQESCK